MTIEENAETFAGLPVEDYVAGAAVDPKIAYRLRVGFEAESPWRDLFASYVAQPGAKDAKALVIGMWGDTATGDSSEEVVELLCAARHKLASLDAIFLGDITFEEAEMSWINQCDVGPLLAAYPKLRVLTVRGGTDLAFDVASHDALERLALESGGLDGEVVRSVAKAKLPKLEHLELWLGTDGYGATWDFDDLEPILEGKRLPSLKSLALRDSEKADSLASTVVRFPIFARLEVLDLSFGVLTDDGARALLAAPGIKKLKRLDLHYHFISEPVMAELRALGIDVDLSDANPPDTEDRYVSVGE